MRMLGPMTALATALSAVLLFACSPTKPDPNPGAEEASVKPTAPDAAAAKPVAFALDPAYLPLQGADLTLDFDQATEMRESKTRADKAWVKSYAKPKDYDKLYLEIVCWVPSAMTIGESVPGPMAGLATLRIYAVPDSTQRAAAQPGARPLATYTKGKGGFTYKSEQVSGFEHDGRGPCVDARDEIRVFLGKTAAGYIRDTDPYYYLNIVGTDAQGRTMFFKQIFGSEATLPIEPRR